MVEKARAVTYPGLDVVRLGAALVVTVYHLAYFLAPTPYGAFSFGWVGVEIFFVISGFVIAFSAQGKPVSKFVRSRVARLYPAAFICTTIIALVSWPRTGVPANAIILYLKSIAIFPIGPWINQVYWTLPIEIVFYALVALSLWRGRSLAFVALALGSWSTAYWIFRLANHALGFVALPDMTSGKYSLLLLHYGVYFALGTLLYLRRHAFAGVVFLVIGFIATADKALGLTHDGAPFFAAPIVWLLAVAIIGASVVWNAHLQHWKTRTAGLATYPLYLLHSSIGVLLFGLVPFPVAVVGGILLAMAVALAVLPMESWLRGFMLRRRLSPEVPSLP